jgi:hypothetical protein
MLDNKTLLPKPILIHFINAHNQNIENELDAITLQQTKINEDYQAIQSGKVAIALISPSGQLTRGKYCYEVDSEELNTALMTRNDEYGSGTHVAVTVTEYKAMQENKQLQPNSQSYESLLKTRLAMSDAEQADNFASNTRRGLSWEEFNELIENRLEDKELTSISYDTSKHIDMFSYVMESHAKEQEEKQNQILAKERHKSLLYELIKIDKTYGSKEHNTDTAIQHNTTSVLGNIEKIRNNIADGMEVFKAKIFK